MAQQTAVEWLVKEFNLEEYKATIDFAKAKERQQMLEIWMQFFKDSYHTKPEFIRLFDKYYNETYGSNNQI